jgi:serine/threonine-protein kinase
MGALAAILALVAIAWALPHVYSILAKQKATSPTQETTPVATANPASTQGASQQPGATTPDTTQAANSAGEPNASGSTNPSGQPASAEGEHKTATLDQQGKPGAQAQEAGGGSQHRQPYSGSTAAGNNDGTAGSAGSGGAGAAAQTGAAQSGATPSVAAGPSKQEIREVHDHFSNIEARADAATANLQNLRSRQQAQGLDVRSDILAAMSRMNSDLREAQSALNEKDLETANQYLDRADKEAKTLESFLGR